MSENNNNYLVYFVLLVMLFVTAMSFLKEPEIEFIPSVRTNTGPHIWIPDQSPKWETLGSEKFYLELRPVHNDYQIGLIESVEVYFVNDYPYDVIISHPDKAEYWFTPEDKYTGGDINWELSEPNLVIPANSTYELYQIDKVGLSNCILYFKTLGQTASLRIWIEG